MQLLNEIVTDGNAGLCDDALELASENGRTDADSLRQCYYMIAKTGTKVALVAYSKNNYASINEDKSALSKITDLKKDLSAKTGDDVVIVAYSVS